MMGPDEVEVEAPPVVWRKITCEERETLRQERGYYYPDQRAGGLTVHSSLTDHYGQYGLPKVFTEWGTYEGEPVLRDVRHPAEDLEHNPSAKDRLPMRALHCGGAVMTTLTPDEVETGRRSFLVQLRAELARDLDEVAVSRTDLRDLVALLEALGGAPNFIDAKMQKRLDFYSSMGDPAPEALKPVVVDREAAAGLLHGYAHDVMASRCSGSSVCYLWDLAWKRADAVAALYPKATEGES